MDHAIVRTLTLSGTRMFGWLLVLGGARGKILRRLSA